jgi:DNA topoisomerase 2-associated protein PAT1
MSNSDKDFITRIQVSQLVTDDPYADDFYFHIMAAIKSSRHNALVANAAAAAGAPIAGEGEQQVRQNAGNGGRNGGRGGERKPTRRENAMSKMAQNVQRLVDVAKQRNNRTGQCASLPLPSRLHD